MSEIGTYRWRLVMMTMLMNLMLALADRNVTMEAVDGYDDGVVGHFMKLANYLFQTNDLDYHHVWPEMEIGWKIIVGSLIACCGATIGSIGGVGGGGIFVPMLTLIIGFDPKSATAVSKCMITGVAASSVYHNLKLRHPSLNMPIIDYDLALLIQPMLMLGISTGVILNVIFADWMVTVLLIILFIGTSSKAFRKGVEMWRKETILKKEAAKRLEANGDGDETEYKLLPSGTVNGTKTELERSTKQEVTLIENVCWKEVGLLAFVWFAFLAIQIGKNYTSTCSIWYWVLNLSQIPVSLGVSGYEAVGLYKGTRTISSKGISVNNLGVGQLIFYFGLGFLSGVVGGLLGIGGGLIMGPLFLELGILPQVSSATATFAMMFSSSMSAVEYYLLKRFPISYAFYFVFVAIAATFFGQHVVRKQITKLERASVIIFILAFTIFVSAISLGGIGIINMAWKIERHEYMGFENLCKYEVKT